MHLLPCNVVDAFNNIELYIKVYKMANVCKNWEKMIKKYKQYCCQKQNQRSKTLKSWVHKAVQTALKC